MRRTRIGAKVLVRLIKEKCDVPFAGELIERGNSLGRKNGAGWIVWAYQHDCPRALIDSCSGIRYFGDETQGSRGNDVPVLDAQHRQPHLVIEIIGRGKDDIVAL